MLAFTLAGIASTAAQTFTLTLQPNTVPAVTQGVAYNQAITAVGGNANYSLAITSGSLPPGIALTGGAGSWALTGTSNTPGSYGFTISATDIDGNTGFRPYTMSIGTAGGLTINPSSLPNGSQGVAYTQTVTASGGSGGYVYSISAGSLPNGLSISSGGVISGTPSAGGSFSFTVFVRDSNGNTGTRAYTVNIGSNILTVLPSTLPNGTQSVPYSQTVSASGGSGPYTFSVTSGSLPNGLSLDSAGNLTGTPTGSGSSTFTVRAVDSVSNFGTRSYTINIGSNILTVSPATLSNGTQGTAYSQTITASGGSAPYTFAVTAGTLPTGLSLSSGGVLSGTPSASGTFNFTVQATDPGFNTGSRSYTVTINLAALTINPSSLPAGTVSTAYSQTVTASGGSAPYSYAVLSGSLPTGLSLNSGTGAITGTPTVAGSYSFTIQATDATPNTGTRDYTINIGSNNILTVSPGTLPNGTQNTAYSQTVSASGGTGPYTFALNAGSLPTGLSLSSGGVISGTPTGGGSSSFTVQATDSTGNTGSQAYTVNIGTTSLTVNPSSLPAGTQNVAYSQTVSASGGTGPYTFTISAGALPTGLSLSSAGVISGTPTGSGSSSFTVRALDSLGNVGTRLYNVNIGTVTLTINPATLPAAVVGRPYRQTVVASGGTAPYSYSITAGALPPGLTLNAATGVISGTPTSPGTAAFTVQARDVNGNTGTRAYTLVNRPDPALDPEVQGVIAAQVATAQRFALAQVTNVTHHLESLHDQFNPCSVNFGIAPPVEQPMQPYNVPGYANPNQLYSPSGQYGTASRYGAPPPLQQLRRPGERDCAADWMSAAAFWTAGAVQFGTMTPAGLTSNNRFNSVGLTAGVDLRMTDRVIVGASLGYGADRTDVGQNGSRSDASSLSASLYASLKLIEPLFLDGAIGYGTLGYDNKRWVSGDSTIVSGKRNGSYWFGAAALSYEWRRGQMKLAPYVRTDFMSASFDGYAEQGSSAQLLTFEAMKVNAVSGAVGLRGSIDIPVSFGTLTPTARVEYRQTGQDVYNQAMYYSDLGPALASTLSQPSASNHITSGAVGLRATAPGGLTAELEYGISSGSAALLMQTIRAALRLPF